MIIFELESVIFEAKTTILDQNSGYAYHKNIFFQSL